MHNSFELMKRNLQILEKNDEHNIEVIVVDDCSTDDSVTKLFHYSTRRSLRIKIIQNEKNIGPGASRNKGIIEATGKYITFVDSDDYLDRNFMRAIGPFLHQDLDCLIFDYKSVDMNGNRINGGKSIGTDSIIPGFVNNRDAMVYTYGSTWGKVYKKSIIDHYKIRFGEFWRSEDMPFTKEALARCESIYYSSEEIYNYVQLGSSLMHISKLNDEKNCQRAFALLKTKLQNQGFDVELKSIELREVLNNSVLIMVGRKEKYRVISNYIRAHYTKEHINNKYFKRYPSYARIIAYLSYYRCIPAIFVIERYRKWKKSRN